jgi:hypothetical protein
MMVMMVSVVVMPAMAMIVAGVIIMIMSVSLAQWAAPG